MVHSLTGFLFITLFALSSAAELTCGKDSKVTPFDMLQEISTDSCTKTKNSETCQQLYVQMREDGFDSKSKELNCSKEGLRRLSGIMTTAEFTVGCTFGGWNHISGALRGVGEAVAQAVIDIEAEKLEEGQCDRDIDKKRDLFLIPNARVPELLRVEIPKDEALARVSCRQLKASLTLSQRRQAMFAIDRVRGRISDPKAKYDTQEQEYVDWIHKLNSPSANGGKSLIASAKDYLARMGIKLECYNNVDAAALVCEAAADLATLATGVTAVASNGARYAKIAKMAAMEKRVNNFADVAASAKRSTAGVSAKITDEADRARVLGAAGNLNNQERVMAFERLAGGGRKLSAEESQQLIKMHNVGSGFGTYSKADIGEKFRLSQEINPKTGKPFFTFDETNLAMRNGITGTAARAGANPTAKAYAERAKGSTYSQDHRLHAESAAAEGKIAEAEEAYKKAYSYYVKEKAVDLKDAKAAQGSLKLLSERDLEELEMLSSASGNVQQLKEISKAKWTLIESDIIAQYRKRNLPGGNANAMEYLRFRYQELKSQAMGKNPLLKKAAAEKIKALKANYPGLD